MLSNLSPADAVLPMLPPCAGLVQEKYEYRHMS